MDKNEAINELIQCYNLYERFKTAKKTNEAISMAIEALGKDTNVPSKWVPASERLPEEDGLYLVTTSKGQVQMHVFNHNGNSEEYWTRCNKAWMPLPEPWKGEEHE